MVARQHRKSVRTDLVGEIAVGADPIGPDEYDVDLGLPHERRRGSVGDERAGNAGVHQLPNRQASALQQWTRLIHKNV